MWKVSLLVTTYNVKEQAKITRIENLRRIPAVKVIPHLPAGRKCRSFPASGTVGEARNDMHLQTGNIAYTMDAVELAERLGCHTFIGAPVGPEITAPVIASPFSDALSTRYKVWDVIRSSVQGLRRNTAGWTGN